MPAQLANSPRFLNLQKILTQTLNNTDTNHHRSWKCCFCLDHSICGSEIFASTLLQQIFAHFAHKPISTPAAPTRAVFQRRASESTKSCSGNHKAHSEKDILHSLAIYGNLWQSRPTMIYLADPSRIYAVLCCLVLHSLPEHRFQHRWVQNHEEPRVAPGRVGDRTDPSWSIDKRDDVCNMVIHEHTYVYT